MGYVCATLGGGGQKTDHRFEITVFRPSLGRLSPGAREAAFSRSKTHRRLASAHLRC
jgi:hypothetical protein